MQVEQLRELRQRSIKDYQSGARIFSKRGKITICNCLRRLLRTDMT